MADEGRRGRQPKDLQGVLNLCMENTKAEDAPAASREISPERKEWLSQALDGMTADPIREVQRLLRTVGAYLGSEDPPQEARSNALDSLDELFDWCESLDMAMDFMKIGGFSILHELLTHSEREFRLQGFRLVGVLVQNNPVCQEAAVREDLLPTMLTVLHTEQDPGVQSQAVQALSCLVRDSEVEGAQELFVAHQGLEVLKEVLQTQGPFKRVVRVAFLLDLMCHRHPQYKDAVCEVGLVEVLASELQGDHEQAHEQVMSAVLSLATNHPPTQRVLAQPHLNMASFLQTRIQMLRGKDENREERTYAEQLLQIIQTSTSS